MAVGSGLAAQFGWKAESTYGTAVTVDRFLPFRSETIQDDYMVSEADDIIAGAYTVKQEQQRQGNKAFTGTVNTYLFNRNVAELFLMALGANSTTGAGPYTHSVTPGDQTGDMMTLQIGRPDNGGTVRPFTYEGVKVQTLSLNVEQGEYATMSVDVIAEDVATGTALATASYPASLSRYHSNDFSVTVGGSSVCVRSFELSIENSLDDTRRCTGTQVIKEPLRNGHVAVSGSMEIEWTDLTMYARSSGLTYAELVATWSKSPDSITITMDCNFTPVAQPVAGRGVVYQTVDFTAVGASTDADSITVAVINADSVA